MTCNLVNNETELRAAFDSVSNSQSGNEWAIFEYDASSNIVKLGPTGNGGFTELLDNFHSGKVQYGFGTVAGNIPAGSSGQKPQRKVILIHWQGEGVAAVRLATTASHIEEIRRFVHRVHLTIHARNDEDLDKEVVAKQLEKVQEIAPNALGDRMASVPVPNNEKEVTIPAISSVPPPLVGTMPSVPMENVVSAENTLPSDDKMPSVPKEKEVAAPAPSSMPPPTIIAATPFIPPLPVGTDYQRPQAQEETDREEREKFWSQMRNEEEARRKEEAERRRQMQEQYTKEQKELAAQLHKAHLEKLEGRQKMQQQGKSQSLDASGISGAKMGQLIAGRTQMFEQKVAELAIAAKPVKKPKNFKWQVGLQSAKPTGVPVNQVPPPPPKQFECVLKRKETPKEEEPTMNNKIPVAPVPPVARQPPAMAAEEKLTKKGEGGGDCPSPSPPPCEPTNDCGAAQMGVVVDRPPPPTVGGIVRAKAIWDYQAEDQTELSFNPGDVITDIQMVHDGWWYGRATSGVAGLFPSNYVERI